MPFAPYKIQPHTVHIFVQSFLPEGCTVTLIKSSNMHWYSIAPAPNFVGDCTIDKFLVRDGRDLVDSGIGLSYRPVRLVGWYYNPMPCRVDYVPHSGTKNLASISVPHFNTCTCRRGQARIVPGCPYLRQIIEIYLNSTQHTGSLNCPADQASRPNFYSNNCLLQPVTGEKDDRKEKMKIHINEKFTVYGEKKVRNFISTYIVIRNQMIFLTWSFLLKKKIGIFSYRQNNIRLSTHTTVLRTSKKLWTVCFTINCKYMIKVFVSNLHGRKKICIFI
jgi:hypothetical protein